MDIAEIRRTLPELPSARRTRFIENLKVTAVQAAIIISDDSLAELFDRTVVLLRICTAPGLAKLITNGLIAILNNKKKVDGPEEILLQPVHFALLADLLASERISRAIYDKVLDLLCGPEGERVDPGRVIEENAWYQINDDAELAGLCDAAMESDPKAVAAYKKGKANAINILIGHVKVSSKDLANMKKVKSIMEGKLSLMGFEGL